MLHIIQDRPGFLLWPLNVYKYLNARNSWLVRCMPSSYDKSNERYTLGNLAIEGSYCVDHEVIKLAASLALPIHSLLLTLVCNTILCSYFYFIRHNCKCFRAPSKNFFISVFSVYSYLLRFEKEFFIVLSILKQKITKKPTPA